MYTAFLLAATTCLAWDGAWPNPIFGSQPGPYYGGSYGGLWWGWDPYSVAAWAPWTTSPWIFPSTGTGMGPWGGYGVPSVRGYGPPRASGAGHHHPDGAPPGWGNPASSCDSCSFAGPGATWPGYPGWGPDGAPALGAPDVAPAGQTAPAPAAGGDTK